MTVQANTKYLGYLKYSGELVEGGFMDARKSAQAITGFDEAIRFFVIQQAPELREVDFEFPIKIQEGSWEMLIPETISGFVKAGGSIFVTAYAVKAAQKMADRDFENLGFKDLYKNALLAIQWVIKIGKHIGDLTIKTFENPKFSKNNDEIGIQNSEGVFLFVPKPFLDLYVASKPSLLAKISELIEAERSLSIGIYEDEEQIEEVVTREHRQIFTRKEEETDAVLLPELEHQMKIDLVGELTKGNERTNTMGLSYQGHILIAKPDNGSIVLYKSCLFLRCRIKGTISRDDDNGELEAKKPKIIFTSIEPIVDDLKGQSSFELE